MKYLKKFLFGICSLVLMNYNVLSYPSGGIPCPNGYYYVDSNIDNINPIIKLLCNNNNFDDRLGLYCCPNCDIINCTYALEHLNTRDKIQQINYI